MTDCWCRRLHGSAAHFHFDENTGRYENAHCDQAGHWSKRKPVTPKNHRLTLLRQPQLLSAEMRMERQSGLAFLCSLPSFTARMHLLRDDRNDANVAFQTQTLWPRLGAQRCAKAAA